MRQSQRHDYTQGVKQFFKFFSRSWYLPTGGLVFDIHFCACKRGKLFHAFFGCDIETVPSGSQLLDNHVSHHNNQDMAAGRFFFSDIDGANLQEGLFAGPKGKFHECQVFVAVMNDFLAYC